MKAANITRSSLVLPSLVIICLVTVAIPLVAQTFPPIRAARPDGHGQLLHAPSATLWYEVRGDGSGTPLMVVNGGPGVPHTYMLVSYIWDRLARNRKVVFYDQRGVGRSPALAKGQSCTFADQISDLEALRKHLAFERMDVLGHSWGGVLAMGYASRYPKRIRHLILCDSCAPKWEDTKFLFKDIFPETVARQESLDFATALGDTRALAAQLREYQSMLACSPDLRAILHGSPPPRLVLPVNTAILADLKQFDLGPELQKYRFPTLVLTGRFDANVAPSVAWKIHQLIPDSQFTAFERSGHLPFFEQPADFLERVERFVENR